MGSSEGQHGFRVSRNADEGKKSDKITLQLNNLGKNDQWNYPRSNCQRSYAFYGQFFQGSFEPYPTTSRYVLNSSTCTNIKFLEAEREVRNLGIVKAMIEGFKGSLPIIEKVLKDLNISSDKHYIFGDKLSLGDLHFIRLKVMLTACELNKDSE